MVRIEKKGVIGSVYIPPSGKLSPPYDQTQFLHNTLIFQIRVSLNLGTGSDSHFIMDD